MCFKTYHFRLKGGLYLSVLETFPIDASEEGVFSDVPLSLSATAQTFGWVFSHQLLMATHTHKKITVRLRIIIIIMIKRFLLILWSTEDPETLVNTRFISLN